MTMLELDNFAFSFAERPILESLSFKLQPGDYLAVIGPNGAGKSTLLKCLLRLHDRGHSSGRIMIKDWPLETYNQKGLARIIGYVPQAGGWIPPFTVSELLRLSRYPYASSTTSLKAPDRAAVERALEVTGLKDLSHRHLKNLSGGERQRAYLAGALAQETEIMLLDEPASFLDPKHAADLNQLLKKLNQEQSLTMITVTHDLNHPLAAGGQVLVLRQGRQLFFGPVEGLLDQEILEEAYNHHFTYFEHPRTGRPAILTD